jgi:hypothetical protein
MCRHPAIPSVPVEEQPSTAATGTAESSRITRHTGEFTMSINTSAWVGSVTSDLKEEANGHAH